MSGLAPGAALAPIARNRRTIIAALAVLSLIIATVGIRALTTRSEEKGDKASSDTNLDTTADQSREPSSGDATAAGAEAAAGGTRVGAETGASAAASTEPGQLAGAPASGAAAASPTTRTPPPGVTEKEVTVAYYWKGDRTRTSPYLAGSGFEANVDEAEAFRKLVDFVNAHADGGATLMGHPINLHGRRIKGVVVEAGDNAEAYAATAQRITNEIKPFAAVAAHGSISAYLCPALAGARIHNLSTYDLAGGLASSTDGYCLPSGMTWEQQVELTEGYLLRHQREAKDRVYGIVYAEYPGLVDSAPKMVDRFKRAGINVGAVRSVSASLTTAQQQMPNVVAAMVQAGVNTIVMPDGGAPINFTHSAQASGYNPDYYVWPCSGQDTMGMVRLLNAAQWARAAGLTCYDQPFAADVANNDAMRKTQWYAAYRSAAPSDAEPPAPTPFVYAALLPLIVGLEGAGPDLTLETFRGALDRFTSYRYDAVDGRTDDATNMLLGLGAADRGLLRDAIKIKYNAARREPGSAAPGTYDFPETRRYASRAAFES